MLGSSLYGGSSGDTVEAMMASRIGVTLEQGLLAVLTGLIIAVPIGIYSAIRQYTVADYVGRSVAIIGLATPNFWLALLVIIYPAIWWKRWATPGSGRLRDSEMILVDSDVFLIDLRYRRDKRFGNNRAFLDRLHGIDSLV